MSHPTAILISPRDNVAVVLSDLAAGEVLCVDNHQVVCVQPLPSGHKVALQAIQLGDSIIKCGVPVGIARAPIQAGEHVHIHNVASRYITDH